MAQDDVALVLLVDRDGTVLLHHRDERPSAPPGQWSLPGGHLGELCPLWSGPRPYQAGFPHTLTAHVRPGFLDGRW